MEKIWLKSYPASVPHEIELNDIGSIGAYFDDIVARFPDRCAFVSGATGVALTYAQLDVLSRRVAGYFQVDLGLAPGTRVALMMPNLLQFPVCLLGLLRAGCVVVNVNPMYTPRELKHQLVDSGAEAMIVAEPFAATVDKAREGSAVRHVVVSGLTDLMPLAKRLIGDFVIRHVKRAIPSYHLPGHVRLRQVLARAPLPPSDSVKVDSSALAFLQYTGGTTGVAKGAMLTHRNVLANARQGLVWCKPFLPEGEVLVNITAIPLYHIFALGNCLGFAGLGGTNVLVADPRNTAAFVAVLRRYPFTSIPAVNTLFNDLTRHPDFAKVDFSQLRIAIGGGAAVQRTVAERWQHITGAPLIEGYGLTECSPTVSVNPFDMSAFNGSIGLPVPSTEVSIRDAQGQPLGVGLAVLFGGLMALVITQARHGGLAASQVMTADGFLRTGDLATMDAHGFLRIVDRLKDMILVSGFNVYPNEVEEVVMMHPEVLEVAAVGRPDASSGERVQVFVVRKSPALDAAALQAHCREHLTRYKVPSQVEFVNELPKSNVGKILRRELRERAERSASSAPASRN